ncbi:MAG: hypothetical protein EBT12_05310 [Marivivens sp.]|nr:hypothetical protein [Marivivens sp.]
MTFNKERHDYIEKQPEVIQALLAHRKRFESIREADRNVIMEARKVTSLMAAFDATIDQQFKQEDVTDEHEKLLKEYTNQDSETWFWRHHQAQEMIQEVIVERCRLVVEAQARHKNLEEDHRACTAIQLARDVAGKRYDELQKQAAQPKRGRPRKTR